MKFIDLENHFFTQGYREFLRSRKDPPGETVESDGLTNTLPSSEAFTHHLPPQ